MRTLGIGILVCCVVIAMLPVHAVEQRDISKATSACSKAARSLRGGDTERAITQYEKALELIPNFPMAHIGLGQIDMAREAFADALRHFETAHDGYADLGAALQKSLTRRYAETQSQIIQMNDQISQLRSYASSQSTANIEIAKLENQIERLRAIEPPTDASVGEPPGEIFFYIGNAQFQMGNLDEALKSWETCAERSPKFAMVYNNLALAYWRTGALDRAVESLSQAEELGFPVNPDFRRDLERAVAADRS